MRKTNTKKTEIGVKGATSVSYSETVNISAAYCSFSASYGITLECDGTPENYLKQRVTAKMEVRKQIEDHLNSSLPADRLNKAVEIKQSIER